MVKSYDDNYVIFKVNGITIKDNKNNALKARVINGLAQLNYTVPAGLAGIYTNLTNRYYTVTAIFASREYYPDTRNTTRFTVERFSVSFNDINITYNNSTRKITIKAKLQDYHNNYLKGQSTMIIKFNGLTYKINGKTQGFVVKNGIVNLSFTIQSTFKALKQVELVTGQRVGYLGGRSKTTDITMI